MIFTEKKLTSGYEYETEQFVGTFKFNSKTQITPTTLDSLVLALSSLASTQGKTDYKGQVVEYVFRRKDLWEEEEELQDKI